jgi:hypothetical protein
MARLPMTVTRWAGAVLASVLLAGVLLATAPGLDASARAGAAVGTRGAAASDAATAISPSVAGCPQETRDAVVQALAASNIPAEIVIIVDISYSMDSRHNNLYGTVGTLVPALIGTLAKLDPQDLVAVITLGTRQNTQVVVRPGQPSRHLDPADYRHPHPGAAGWTRPLVYLA